MGREPKGGTPISLDQLIALNEEIAALARAGLPLERGLINLGTDLPGRLSTVATMLGERMSRGESLSEALDSAGAEIPRVYRAVVEAGLRSGRLSVALEGLATYARGFAEARRNVGLALWYPTLVLSVAYVFLIGFMLMIVPRFVSAFDTLRLPERLPLRALDALSRSVGYWGPILPILLLCFLVSWFRSSQAVGFGTRRAFGVLRWFPWLGGMLAGYEASSYADLMALLVGHGVPYPDALRLAGEASCDVALADSSRALAEAVASGQAPGEALRGPSAFPPLLRWALAVGPRHGDLPGALRVMADRYRVQARREAEKIRLFLPAVLLIGIGVTATALYAATLFLPLASLWYGLARSWS